MLPYVINGVGMNEKAVQKTVLRKFYEKTKSGGVYVPQEKDFTPCQSRDVLLAAADQLAVRGLLDWRTRKGTGLETSGKMVDGYGSITSRGIAQVEHPLLAAIAPALKHPMMIGIVSAIIAGAFSYFGGK